MTDHQHEFMVAPSQQSNGLFYKTKENGVDDRRVGYATLYCRTCGATKEVVAFDTRKQTVPRKVVA